VGVIDSLSAGYRLLGKRVWLLLLPVALDLLLWRAPRLNIAPLLQPLVALNREAAAAGLPGDVAGMASMGADALARMGESSNLFTGLVSGALLHVPSLFAAFVLPLAGQVVEVTSAALALAAWVALLLLGLWIGVVYLSLLARVVPIGRPSRPVGWRAFLRATGQRWQRVLGFLLLAGVLLTAIYIPVAVALSLLLVFVPALGTMGMFLLGGTFFVVYFYLYFVTAAIVMDDLPVRAAVACSIWLVRFNFWSIAGFILLYNVIGAGIGLVLSGMAAAQPLGTIAAIVVNAYIGTGLAIALLVFYRSRVLLTRQTLAMKDAPSP
jgi:hypothetical protein